MNSFTPKINFQTLHTDYAALFREAAPQPYMKAALAYALAEYSARCPNEFEMRGARGFIAILINLGEKDEEVPKFPKHELTTFDHVKPKATETK